MSETLWGQPKGLAVCSFTEVWERFAYFGMLSILILYLTKSYGVDDADGNRIVGAFGALVYMLPVVGGAIADHWLGSRKSVVFALLLLSAAYLSIALPSDVTRFLGLDYGPNGLPPIGFLFLSMSTIIVGVGFLKSNVASVVGSLYTNPSERDIGVSIFYWAVNVGGGLGPFACSAIGEAFGVRYSFFLAGGTMFIALASFLWGQRYLPTQTGPPEPERLQRKIVPWLSHEQAIYLAGIMSIAVVWQVLEFHDFVPRLLIWFGAGLILALVYFIVRHCDAEERGNMIVVGTLLVFAVLFATINFQLYGSLILFTDRYINRQILGFQYTAPMIITLSAALVLIIIPVSAFLWNWLEKRGRPVSFPAKFSIGLFLTALTFLVPALAVSISGDTSALHSGWLLLALTCFVAGDVCVVPVGLSMVPTLCPKRVVAMMIGAFYLMLSIGNSWGGEVAARFTSAEELPTGDPVAFSTGLSSFVSLYIFLGSVGIGGSLLLAALTPVLKRTLRPTHESSTAT